MCLGLGSTRDGTVHHDEAREGDRVTNGSCDGSLLIEFPERKGDDDKVHVKQGSAAQVAFL